MIKVNSTDLSESLSFLYQAYKNKTPQPIMQDVLLDVVDNVLTMTQTNGDQTLTYSIPCEGENQSFTVEMKKLKERASQYQKDKSVSISFEDGMSHVKCGRSKIKLKSMSSNDYPVAKQFSEFDTASFDGASLKRALSLVKNAQAVNDVRYYLNGILIELSEGQCDMIATDGHRLHHCGIPSTGASKRSFIIPSASVAPIYKYLDSGEVTIMVNDNLLKITDEESSIQTTLIDGKFPNWRGILPKDNPVLATFNRQDLDMALRGAMITSNEKFKGVRLTLSDGSATFEANSPDGTSSEEVIECAVTGSELIELGFNGQYVLDAISSIESEAVGMALKDGNSPSLIKDGDFQAIVMPMRL